MLKTRYNVAEPTRDSEIEALERLSSNMDRENQQHRAYFERLERDIVAILPALEQKPNRDAATNETIRTLRKSSTSSPRSERCAVGPSPHTGSRTISSPNFVRAVHVS